MNRNSDLLYQYVRRILRESEKARCIQIGPPRQLVKDMSHFVRDLYPNESPVVEERQTFPRSGILAPQICSVTFSLQDFVMDNWMLRFTGNGVSASTSSAIQICMRKLASNLQSSELQHMRFWGVFGSSGNDIYVFEAVQRKGESIYFATTHLYEHKPAVLEDVNDEGLPHDGFKCLPGGLMSITERQLLRRRIIEIDDDTRISLAGEFTMDGGRNGDFNFARCAKSTLEDWIQKRPISPNGDSTNIHEESEPVPPDLRILTNELFSIEEKNGHVVIKSNKWTGAVTVASQKQYVSLYIRPGLPGE
jgi:hypothetical protein